MSDMVSLSAFASLFGVISVVLSIMKERAKHEREMGRIEAEAKALRERVDRIERRSNQIDEKLEKIIETLGELKANLK